MAVVVVFPLIVAVILGSVRLVGEIGDAVDESAAAAYVDNVDVVVAVEASATVVAGRQAAGTLVVSDRVPLVDAITRLDAVRTRPGLPPAAAQAENAMSDAATHLRDLNLGSQVSIDDLTAIQHTITGTADTVVESVLRPMNSVAVGDGERRLLDIWAAQRQIFQIAVGLVKIIVNPADPGTQLTAAIGAESVLLDRLRTEIPGDPRISHLQAALAAENPLIAKVRVAIPAGPAAVRAVGYGDALVHDLSTYEALVADQAHDIAATVDGLVSQARYAAVRDSVLLMLTLVLGLTIAAVVAQALLRPLHRLHDSARRLAEVDLPAEVELINTGDPDAILEITAVPVDSDEEIGAVARAVDDIHDQALNLASRQRQLRLLVNDLFDALARRTNSLLECQLRLIEALERNEEDPHRLTRLFELDHLATRMRRNGDNLLVLAGTQVARIRSDAMPIQDVVRAAASEVEDYRRVQVAAAPEIAITGAAAIDVVHLLAELLDNALRSSPPLTEVDVHCERGRDGGAIVEIVDHGSGIIAADLELLNDRLASPPEIEAETARRMGLYVVGRLAERHGITVRLRPTDADRPATGITAEVRIPPLNVRTILSISE
ncbi:HAMP domain-containing protein [Nocardia sp. NEAU-G5]|uniref:histidine kinase n=1 Tax=Nocardia albiluteola TaxID=2842303 RepID=A0ABS6B4T7_9NOCA|nr:ATP-binding protein [Nocardia albiluteola]MBU3065327.1 HAMP domain-containing protein [Nocardia albiluteola]